MVNEVLENRKRRQSGSEYTTVFGKRVARKSPPTEMSIIFIMNNLIFTQPLNSTF